MHIISITLALVLLGISFHAFNGLADMKCISKPIRDGWTIITMFAVIMITMGISESLCQCAGVHSGGSNKSYIYWFLALGLSLIITSAVMIAEFNRPEVVDTCSMEVVKKDMIAVLVIGCVVFTSAIVYLKK